VASNSIKVSAGDLSSIFNRAKVNFQDNAVKGLDSQEFVARCYLQACSDYLNSKGIGISLTFDADLRDNDVVREDD
jgi:hypothetical protein